MIYMFLYGIMRQQSVTLRQEPSQDAIHRFNIDAE